MEVSSEPKTRPASQRALRYASAMLIAVLAAINLAAAQPARKPSPSLGKDGISAETRPDVNLLQIDLETSRAHPTVGTGLGIQAVIKNVSDKTIVLLEKTTELTVPPELKGSSSLVYASDGLFPTQHTWASPGVEEKFNGRIVLQPGSTYVVEWTNGPEGADGAPAKGPFAFVTNMLSVISSELNFVFFTPGDYKVDLVTQYWVEPNLGPDEYRTVTQTATVNVAAPQSVILFGAAVGGLLAFLILPRRDMGGNIIKAIASLGQSWLSRSVSAVIYIARMTGAMLLSALVTILLARISETQFLIRVTVADFWGAIAIGFVANYLGARAFDQILRGRRNERDSTAKA